MNYELWGLCVVDVIRPLFTSVDAPLTIRANVKPPSCNVNAHPKQIIHIEFYPYELKGGEFDGVERDNGFSCDLSELARRFPGTKISINYTPNSPHRRGEIVIDGIINGVEGMVLVCFSAGDSAVPAHSYDVQKKEYIPLTEKEIENREALMEAADQAFLGDEDDEEEEEDEDDEVDGDPLTPKH